MFFYGLIGLIKGIVRFRNMMRKLAIATFEIHSYESALTKEVTAQGIAEAMLDYLPWPSLDVSIKWSPSNGEYTVIDNQTDFKYLVKLI
jgi:hypothetical protein